MYNGELKKTTYQYNTKHLKSKEACHKSCHDMRSCISLVWPANFTDRQQKENMRNNVSQLQVIQSFVQMLYKRFLFPGLTSCKMRYWPVKVACIFGNPYHVQLPTTDFENDESTPRIVERLRRANWCVAHIILNSMFSRPSAEANVQTDLRERGEVFPLQRCVLTAQISKTTWKRRSFMCVHEKSAVRDKAKWRIYKTCEKYNKK